MDKEQARYNHYAKYQKIIDNLQSANYVKAVTGKAIGVKRIIDAIASGDGHLNSIRLSEWDSLAISFKSIVTDANRKAHNDFWSLAIGVCTLKHIATYYIAQVEPPKNPQGEK